MPKVFGIFQFLPKIYNFWNSGFLCGFGFLGFLMVIGVEDWNSLRLSF